MSKTNDSMLRVGTGSAALNAALNTDFMKTSELLGKDTKEALESADPSDFAPDVIIDVVRQYASLEKDLSRTARNTKEGRQKKLQVQANQLNEGAMSLPWPARLRLAGSVLIGAGATVAASKAAFNRPVFPVWETINGSSDVGVDSIAAKVAHVFYDGAPTLAVALFVGGAVFAGATRFALRRGPLSENTTVCARDLRAFKAKHFNVATPERKLLILETLSAFAKAHPDNVGAEVPMILGEMKAALDALPPEQREKLDVFRRRSASYRALAEAVFQANTFSLSSSALSAIHELGEAEGPGADAALDVVAQILLQEQVVVDAKQAHAVADVMADRVNAETMQSLKAWFGKSSVAVAMGRKRDARIAKGRAAREMRAKAKADRIARARKRRHHAGVDLSNTVRAHGVDNPDKAMTIDDAQHLFDAIPGSDAERRVVARKVLEGMLRPESCLPSPRAAEHVLGDLQGNVDPTMLARLARKWRRAFFVSNTDIARVQMDNGPELWAALQTARQA